MILLFQIYFQHPLHTIEEYCSLGNSTASDVVGAAAAANNAPITVGWNPNPTHFPLSTAASTNGTVCAAKEPPKSDQPNTALLSTILMFGTYLLANQLKVFKNSHYLGKSVSALFILSSSLWFWQHVCLGSRNSIVTHGFPSSLVHVVLAQGCPTFLCPSDVNVNVDTQSQVSSLLSNSCGVPTQVYCSNNVFQSRKRRCGSRMWNMGICTRKNHVFVWNFLKRT